MCHQHYQCQLQVVAACGVVAGIAAGRQVPWTGTAVKVVAGRGGLCVRLVGSLTNRTAKQLECGE